MLQGGENTLDGELPDEVERAGVGGSLSDHGQVFTSLLRQWKQVWPLLCIDQLF